MIHFQDGLYPDWRDPFRSDSTPLEGPVKHKDSEIFVGKIRNGCLAAHDKGIYSDLGRGAGSFGFHTVKAMVSCGSFPDTISSDVHSLSIDRPAFDLLVTMSKFLNLGMSLNDVIVATTTTPSWILRRSQLGSLKAGSLGDASVPNLRKGSFDYADCDGETIKGTQRLFGTGRGINDSWLENWFLNPLS